ncbi:MAG TPA: GGDEF domain-containing protein [Actinophytocola sp.]|uniref:GGDEF domain-containing protein n=1 Tax=Actinophytocola sp. TaxID=1872138 RepID=UPI002DBA0869|nr:GGDEF domain-containing protein [Actinophytocola sp.]HEU5472541.1 GGDEF domain-containing protein [Actinophytocola sp.]
MSTEQVSSGIATRLPVVRNWALWHWDKDLIAYSLCVVLAAAATVAGTAFTEPVTGSDLAILAVLAVLGLLQSELGRQVEKRRPRVLGRPHVNLTSVWLVPGLLLLPLVLTTGLVLVLYGHLHARGWYSTTKIPLFRTVINISIVVLTCYVTGLAVASTGMDDVREAVLAGWPGVGAIVIGIGTYFVVNLLLVIPALNRPLSLQHLFGTGTDNLFEVATLCLGAVVAVLFAVMPAIAVLIVPPLFLLHRAVLINQLEAAARKDPKTGVWNIAGWHRIAYHELVAAERRAAPTFGVLMVDLDHFKRINDTHGHLVGDAVLKVVADTISATVRADDAVGRFGGEEFIVLLPDTGRDHIHAIAERIRAAIATLEFTVTEAGRQPRIRGLSVSVGVAVYPAAGKAIERLLQAADAAMYRAKSNGRNQVAS